MRIKSKLALPALAFLSLASLTGVPASAGPAGCYRGDLAVPSSDVRKFLENPADLLTRYPAGGGALIREVRDLVASDTDTLDPVVLLLKDANKEQKFAIGTALAQAAGACVRSNKKYAGQVQEAVAKGGDQSVLMAFTAASGDRPTTAVGGAGAGSAGASGGQVTPLNGLFGGFGPAEYIGATPVRTPFFAYTSSVTGTGGVFDDDDNNRRGDDGDDGVDAPVSP